MEETIFRHMETVRDLTLKAVENIPSDVVEIVPEGFNNNIHWNFGHIAFIQERHCYVVAGDKSNLPNEYETYFTFGTKPADWTGTPPSIEEIAEAMKEQTRRIKETHAGRLENRLPEPYTTKMGVTFETVGDALLFSLYHESFHVEVIKQIYKAIRRM